jgi:hypothetical protein
MVKTAVKVSASVFVLSAIIGGTNLVRGSLLERTMSLAIAQPLVAMWKVYDFASEAVKEHLPGESKAAPGFQIVIEQFWLLRNYAISHKHL